MSNDIRIVHIITGLNTGGAEMTLFKVLKRLDPRFSPHVISLTDIGEVGRMIEALGIPVEALNMHPGKVPSPAAFFRLVRRLKTLKPDIVQTWMYHADLLGGGAAHLAGNRNIVWGVRRTLLGGSVQTVLVMKVCALLSRWIPKKIICVAEAAREAHVAAGYDAVRMVVIPNGFDFSQLTATIEQRMVLRRDCHFSEDDVVVGCLGRFHPDKGQDNFVKAAAIVARSQQKVKFLLVGRGCDMHNPKLIGWLNEYGLQDRFVLLGERSDVPICLAAMDVFCMPSGTEGFPNSLGEAMAMGLPCVATRVGDASLLAGHTAILIPAQDEQALAQGLLKVIAMPDKQRYLMGQSAKMRVIEEFSIGKMLARFDAVYKEVVSEGKA